MSEPSPLVFDPAALTETQRAGTACAVCHKTWPMPDTMVGRLPDDRPVFACAECADVLGVSRAPDDRGDPAPQP